MNQTEKLNEILRSLKRLEELEKKEEKLIKEFLADLGKAINSIK